MGNIILTFLLAHGIFMSTPSTAQTADSNWEFGANVTGTWVVKSMFCARSEFDILNLNNRIGISQRLEISPGEIVETARYRECVRAQSYKISAMAGSFNPGMGLVSTGKFNLKLSIPVPALNGTCESPGIQEIIGGNEKIQINYFKPGLLNSMEQEKIIMKLRYPPSQNHRVQHCDPDDMVILTLVRRTDGV